MTKTEALSLKANDVIRVRTTGAVSNVWKAPTADNNNNVIVWFNDGDEWAFHSEVDKIESA